MKSRRFARRANETGAPAGLQHACGWFLKLGSHFSTPKYVFTSKKGSIILKITQMLVYGRWRRVGGDVQKQRFFYAILTKRAYLVVS